MNENNSAGTDTQILEVNKLQQLNPNEREARKNQSWKRSYSGFPWDV